MFDPLRTLLVLGATALGALALHVVLFRTLFRFGWKTDLAAAFRDRLRWPARAVTATTAVLVAVPLANIPVEQSPAVFRALVIALILALAGFVLRGVETFEDVTLQRHDVNVRDNLLARRRRTQVQLLRRVATVLVGLLSLSGILMTFPTARSVGASLLASAGLIGLIAGVAARSSLANLIAGVQIAIAEPIRIDDVIVVEGEWGNIEEINLTYVVLRLWDRRRLILPTSYFVEQPFQNWTRYTAQVLGSVTLHLDHRTPVDLLRAELHEHLRSNDRWDGDAWVLQVVDTTETSIVVRTLATAQDAPTAWDLRCDIREHLVAWLRDNHPEALPRTRVAPAEGPTSDDRDEVDLRDQVDVRDEVGLSHH